MQPLHRLLHRIKWDAEFGKGVFALGYYDRVARQEVIVPLASISLDANGMSFQTEDGMVARVPLHRVRTVYKDGVVVWRRPGHPAGE